MTITRKLAGVLLSGLLLAGASSCSKTPAGWSVSGNLGSEAPARVAIEGYNNGIWYPVDSVDTRKGEFAYHSPAPAAYPEIMRLSAPGLTPVYFPAQGTDAIRIEGRRVSGSLSAAAMNRVDSLLALKYDSRQDLQRAVAAEAINDSSVIVAYYVLNKSLDGTPLFLPGESFGNRFYGAVAQRFATMSPDDPRGAVIRELYLRGRKQMGKGTAADAPEVEIELPATGLFDITRYDSYGQEHSLAAEAAKGKTMLLSFTAYGAEYSPAYTVILNEIKEKYGDRLEIYQIAFDQDEVLWKESARSMPWIAVYNSPTDGIEPLVNYNVGTLPTTFIISKGDLVERVADPTTLATTLPKYM